MVSKKSTTFLSKKVSNRLSYTIIAAFALILTSVLVYALGAVPNPGHAVSELQKCDSDGQILKMASGAWTCAADSGGTSQWTTSGSNVHYTSGNVGIGMPSPSSPLQVCANPSCTAGPTITIGNDVVFRDIDAANTFAIYGVTDATLAAIKLGSTGGTIYNDGGHVAVFGTGLPTGKGLMLSPNDVALWGKRTNGTATRLIFLGNDDYTFINAAVGKGIRFRVGDEGYLASIDHEGNSAFKGAISASKFYTTHISGSTLNYYPGVFRKTKGSSPTCSSSCSAAGASCMAGFAADGSTTQSCSAGGGAGVQCLCYKLTASGGSEGSGSTGGDGGGADPCQGTQLSCPK